MFNSSVNVYKAEWLDLVFANRNKSYGAYQLRAKSSQMATKALFIASGFFLMVFFAPLVYSRLYPNENQKLTVDKVTPVKLDEVVHAMKKADPLPEKKHDKVQAAPAKLKTIAVPSKIVVVNEENLTPPPTLKEMQVSIISDKTQDGLVGKQLVATKLEGVGNGDGKAKEGDETGESNKIEEYGVDENPEFSGGMKAWTKYMERNLRYPDQAVEAQKQGKVFVSFVVEKDGSITDVKVIKGIGFGFDEEAIRVIKKSPLWKPGKNKGIPVRVRYTMPITFTLL